MSKTPRTLESFSKDDLVQHIKCSAGFIFHPDEILRQLAWVEWQRKAKELERKSEALCAEMEACKLPQDWNKYKALSGEWDRVQRAWDRNNKAIES